ncbi:aspartic peptidase domain-containing protein [Gautieria morchelliformis]|nr:aspartic peptidase domain-containing protein [Gautieria morchelliformis]
MAIKRKAFNPQCSSPYLFMASLGNHILEVNNPDFPDHLSSYIRDVLKWGFTISESSQMCGIFFRDGKLIQRTQAPTNASIETTATLHTPSITQPSRFQHPSLVDAVRMEMVPSYDPRRSLQQDHVLSAYDLDSTSEYTVTVGIPGVPDEQLFRVQLDTGSSSRWVLGARCKITKIPSDRDKHSQPLPLHAVYNHGPTARCYGKRRFAIKYRDGSELAGPVYDDSWSFTTRTGSKLSVHVVFGVAEVVDYQLALSRIDGVLGLGFQPPAEGTFGIKEPRSFSTTLRAQDKTTNYLFCIGITSRGGSFLSLGCIPPHVREPRFWIPVISDKGTWIIPCYGFGWGHSPSDKNFEKVTLPQPDGSIEVLLDSGTTHCYFPNDIVYFTYQKLGGRKGSQGFQFQLRSERPHRTNSNIWINLGGHWTLWPHEAFYGELAEPAVSPAHDAWFHGRLKSQGDNPSTCSILGAAFFEHHYVYFNADPNGAKVALERRS